MLTHLLCSSVGSSSSIREHLTLLLNARRGSLTHIPTYGLPDIGEIYQGLPYSLQLLKTEIVKLIEKYEPRLTEVKVFHHPIQTHNTVIHLEIHGLVRHTQKLFFNVYFLSGGEAVIQE